MLNQKIIIFCGPSGVGKSAIAEHILRVRQDDLTFSISATTRPKRDYEIENNHYYFFSSEKFLEKIKEGAFIEYEEVYEGIFYGTLFSEIQRIADLGKHVIFDIDVQGSLRLKEMYKEKALTIFIQPPSFTELEERLAKRGTENKISLAKRLNKAREEMLYSSKFDKVVINDTLDQAKQETERIINNFLS